MRNGIGVSPGAAVDVAAIEALRGLPTTVVSDVMGRLEGSVGLNPVNRSPVSACGAALTVKVRAGDNLLVHKALDLLRPGQVLVVDGEGDVSRALIGELMLSYAMVKGAVGFVVDAAVRDVHAFEMHRFPCWSRGVNLRGPYKEGPGMVNVPVTVAGLRVNPGDIVIGDADGVVAVAPPRAQAVSELARQKIDAEQRTLSEIRAGHYSSAWVDELMAQKTGG